VSFALDVRVDEHPDDDGVYQVRIEPLHIATFGSSPEDALVQAEDAVRSYVAAMVEQRRLIDQFRLMGVEFQANRVVSAGDTSFVEIPLGEPDRRRATGRALVPAG